MSKVIKARFVISKARETAIPEDAPKHPEGESACLSTDTTDAIYQETKAMLEDLIAQAQSKADYILLKAREEAQELRERAAEEVQALKDSAWQEGYARGQNDARENSEKEFNELYGRVLSLMDGIRRDSEQLLIKHEQDIIEIILAVIEKVLGTVVEAKPEIIVSIVRNLLEQVREAEKITVRVNPVHIPYLSGYEEVFKELNTENLQIVEDPAIGPGDCLISTENGFLDSRIDEQMRVLRQALQEVVDYA